MGPLLTLSSLSAYNQRLSKWGIQKFPHNRRTRNGQLVSSSTKTSFFARPSHRYSKPRHASGADEGQPLNGVDNAGVAGLTSQLSPPHPAALLLVVTPDHTRRFDGSNIQSSRSHPHGHLIPNYCSRLNEHTPGTQLSSPYSPPGHASVAVGAEYTAATHSNWHTHQPSPPVSYPLDDFAVAQDKGRTYGSWRSPAVTNMSCSSASITGSPTSESLHSFYSTPLSATSIAISKPDHLRNTQLHSLAASAPDFERLESLIKTGVDIGFQNTAGETFLHVLVPKRLGNKLPDLLLSCRDRGFEFMQRSNSGVTAIHAVLNSISDMEQGLNLLSILPKLQVNLYARDRFNTPAVDTLYLWRDRITNSGTNFGATSMRLEQLLQSYASQQRKRLPLVTETPPSRSKLLEADQGISKLVEADEAMSQFVERSWFNPQAEDETGKTRLVCLILMVRPRFGSPSECPPSRIDLIKSCLKTEIDVNAYDKAGFTALHHLLLKPLLGSEEEAKCVLRLLLEAGADVHLRDRTGGTALHLACQSGLPECTALLIQHITESPYYYHHHAPGVNATNDEGRSVVAEARLSLAFAQSALERVRIQQCIDQVNEAGGR